MKAHEQETATKMVTYLEEKKTRSTVIGMVGAILWWVHLAVGTETLLRISMSVQCILYFRTRSPFYGPLFAVTGVCSSRSVLYQN